MMTTYMKKYSPLQRTLQFAIGIHLFENAVIFNEKIFLSSDNL